MSMIKVSAIIFCFLILSEFVAAQDDDIVRIETNIVSIGVNVRDKSGNFVRDLPKEAFEIYDNKIRRSIDLMSIDDAPVSYGIVYDLHPTTFDRTATILNALKTFTETLREKDDFFTVVFNENGSLETGFVPSVEQVRTHLSTLEKDKPSSLYDALYVAGQKLKSKNSAKKTLIILTDGRDQNSHHSFNTLKFQLRSFNVQVFSIFLDDKEKWGFSDISLERRRMPVDFDDPALDRAAIDELAKDSGGNTRTPFVESEAELVRILGKIANDMQAQYSIGFVKEDSEQSWHEIEVKLAPKFRDRKLRLSYKKGYQSYK